MLVLGERVEGRLAVAPAHRDDRELAIERDELLRELVVRERDERLDDALALAVVAEPARLHERRQAAVLERAEPRGRDAEAAEELLLDEAILPMLERPRVGHRTDAPRRLDRDVLELVRDGVGAVGEAVEGARVVVRRRRAARPRRPRTRRAPGRGSGSARRAAPRRARACARAARPRCSRRAHRHADGIGRGEHGLGLARAIRREPLPHALVRRAPRSRPRAAPR